MTRDAQHPVFVVGMGIAADDLTAAQRRTIRSAHLLVGGQRHLDRFADLPIEKLTIAGDLSNVMAAIRADLGRRRIVVLASGDPLLFGIGARIAREIGPEAVTVLPNVSAVAAAFARIGRPWGQARIVSLHGR
ncbi:MAG: precorrin-6y C5,15-methyltransferase (decarboxylating) subunit CbiE, partial [Desulfatitalea sp.]|nr:precorrin-6y C5,15-methyltransferase (decarboxylating) subunit CbiE [Desulfatitalea sp.]